MSALASVRRVRALLLGALTLSSLLWALALLLGVVGAALTADALFGLPLGARRLVVPLATTGAVLLALYRLLRGRGVLDPARVALFLEERTPALEFALITAVRPAGPVDAGALETMIHEHFSPRVAAPDIARAVLPPLCLVLALGFLLALPGRGLLDRILSPRAGDLLAAPAAAADTADPLRRLVVRVDPPPYLGAPSRVLENPLTVDGVEGSLLTIQGRGARGDPTPPTVTSPAGARPSRVQGDTWSVALPMPREPEVLRLAAGARTRLLSLEPILDRAPTVTLRLPASDTTYATGRAQLILEAEASDDFGLGSAWFELLLTTGSGERFTTRSWTVALTRPVNARDAKIRAPLALDSLRLGPGDVLNIRALALDRNDIGGPSTGSSDTRTLRIADPDQGEGVKIVPAAAATLDTTVLSQRMLIIRAETLLVRRRRIPPDSFRVQATRLGERQQMLRDRVQALILELETATDVGFIEETEESRVLRRASLAMRSAAAELALARVGEALPEMYRALKALDEGRTARRVYLRGMLQRVVVDLDQVRLKGTDKGIAGARPPRPAREDPRSELLRRLDRLLAEPIPEPALADSLLLLRSRALALAPGAAPPLAAALDALRARQDPRPSLLRFRRTLLPGTASSSALSGWAGVP